MKWVVMLHDAVCYGPFDDEDEASRFAVFLRREVDPGKVMPLRSSVGELLRWYDAVGKDMP